MLCNDFHTILRNRPEVVAGWSDDEKWKAPTSGIQVVVVCVKWIIGMPVFGFMCDRIDTNQSPFG